jgi:hypothetical protein
MIIGIPINTTVIATSGSYNTSTVVDGTTRVSMISRCFGCCGRIAASLPSPRVVDAVLSLSLWDHYDNTSIASFQQAMAGWRFDDDIPWDFPTSILPNAQMIARVNNWLGGSMRPYLVYNDTTPASDPLYYLHLTNVDRLTNKWLTKHLASSKTPFDQLSPTSRNGEAATQCIAPFLPLTRTGQLFSDSASSMAYRYDH